MIQQKKNTLNAVSIAKYVFMGTGILMIIIALFLFHSTNQFIEKSSEAQGIVVQMRYVSDMDTSGYRPVVEFTTRQSDIIRFESNFASNPPSYQVGDRVQVLYDAAAPQNAKIKSFFALWFGVLIVGGLGIGFSIVGGVIFLWSSKS